MQSVAVDQRCEFLSAAWVAEAERFLTSQVTADADLSSLRFSLSEVFADAPPGLESAHGSAAWHFRLDHGSLDVAASPYADADMSVSGDYQAVLELAQAVYEAGPEAMARAQREMSHRMGPATLQVSGRAPDHPALQRLLVELHDHMAARTVENPDFEHRVRRLGLERQVAELADRGYTIIENAVTSEFADELRERVMREVRDHHPFTTNGLMLRDRMFEEVALHPLARTAAESVVGQGMVLGAMSGTYKEAGPGAIGLHADYPLVRDPYPEFGLICVACWALEDWTEAAGPTWVIPGSHRRRRAPRRDERLEGGEPVLMPKGSIALWGNGVWHWQGDRTARDARVAIHVTYNRVFVRQLDDFSRLDDAAYARNPPAFATLMGQDDPFGKSSFQGHDAARFRYAARTLQT